MILWCVYVLENENYNRRLRKWFLVYITLVNFERKTVKPNDLILNLRV